MKYITLPKKIFTKLSSFIHKTIVHKEKNLTLSIFLETIKFLFKNKEIQKLLDKDIKALLIINLIKL